MNDRELLDTAGQWLTIFALIGAGSLIWVLLKSEKRRKFMKDGTVDLRALWQEFRTTFRAGVIVFIIFFASMLGVVIGGAMFG